MHEYTRNRVENIARKVKEHKLFSGRVYKGKYSTLKHLLHTIGHSMAYELRQYQHFDTFGPWPHCTDVNGVPNPP